VRPKPTASEGGRYKDNVKGTGLKTRHYIRRA
jgi:hypothetical protein